MFLCNFVRIVFSFLVIIIHRVLYFCPAMNPSDLETLRWMAKKRKTSTTVAPKRARTEAVLVQPAMGGSSRVANTPRKEKSAPTKVVTPVRSIAPMESVPRPSASSSKRSLGGLKISIRMFDRRPDVPKSVSSMKVFLNIEDKRNGIDNYRVAHSLLKSVILSADVQTFEEVGGAFRIHDSYDSLLQVHVVFLLTFLSALTLAPQLSSLFFLFFLACPSCGSFCRGY